MLPSCANRALEESGGGLMFADCAEHQDAHSGKASLEVFDFVLQSISPFGGDVRLLSCCASMTSTVSMARCTRIPNFLSRGEQR